MQCLKCGKPTVEGVLCQNCILSALGHTTVQGRTRVEVEMAIHSELLKRSVPLTNQDYKYLIQFEINNSPDKFSIFVGSCQTPTYSEKEGVEILENICRLILNTIDEVTDWHYVE